jgi:hypothetical protein
MADLAMPQAAIHLHRAEYWPYFPLEVVKAPSVPLAAAEPGSSQEHDSRKSQENSSHESSEAIPDARASRSKLMVEKKNPLKSGAVSYL